MTFDSITETISHFIGVFSIQLERARLREEYDEFVRNAELFKEAEHLIHVGIGVDASHSLSDLTPGIKYHHGWPEIPDDYFRLEGMAYIPAGDAFYDPFPLFDPLFFSPDQAIYGAGSFSYALPQQSFELMPAGSVAVVVQQATYNVDRDIFLSDGVMPQTIPYAVFEEQLSALRDMSNSNKPLPDVVQPAQNEDAMISLIETMAQSIQALNANYDASAADGVSLGADASGLHLNGTAVDELPRFKMPENGDATVGSAVDNSGGGSVTVEAGGNTLINQAVLVDAWVLAPVMVVMNDWISLDVVMQTNVWRDVDHGTGWSVIPDKPTETFNLARITSEENEPQLNAVATARFPDAWVVATLDTNLVSYNWLHQTNTIFDEDIVTLGASGSGLYLQTGGNEGYNLISLTELGLQFDIVIVGGSAFHLNMIDQTNVLLDDDYVSGDTSSFGDGVDALLGSDNMLWNSATIHSVGQTELSSLPPDLLAAVNDMENGGNGDLPDWLLQSDAFAGLNTLKVLYVEGSLIELNYLKQTNVLSDADQLTLLEHAFEPGSTIELGGNTLANFAAIIEVGPDTTTYVGGEIYTDALLYQAEFVDEEAAPMDVTAPLASEAVAFLADGLVAGDDTIDSPVIVATASLESATPDIMQSVTG